MHRTIRLCAVGALATSVLVALPASADSHLETVLTGVDNGRGLTFDDAGNLYVASAGRGGEGPCIASPEGEGSTCYGETGAILRLDAADIGGDAEAAGDQVHVGSLPSLAPQEGDFAFGDAIGPADVSIGADGRLYFTIGLGADPAVRDDDLEAAANEDALATLHSVVAADGTDLQLEADLGRLEASDDPDGAGPDSNPFGVVADTANDLATVADSGGNTVVAVPLDGADPSVLAVLPPTFVPAPPFIGAPAGTNIPAQAVPTQHAMLDDGSYALGQLTGFPFAVGAAGVWNVTGDGATPWYAGFTNIMDVAQGPDGAIYVLELVSEGLLSASFENPPMGALIRVTEDGDGTITRELLVDDVLMPGGLAIEGDHAYMTQGAGLAGDVPLPGAGDVVRVDLSTAEPLLTVVDDAASTDEDERLTVDVAANDDGVAGVTPLGIAQGAVTGPDVTYQPPVHTAGTDQVVYRACDADGSHCANGVLTVTIDETATDRIDGSTRVLTAVEASMAHFPDGAPAVLVARADLYPDALAGGPLAAAVGGPILLTASGELDAAVAAEIARLGPSTAYVLGGTAALSGAVEDAVGELVGDVQRLDGRNRFATAVAVKNALEAATGEAAVKAFVVEGADPDPARGWPDAVAISAQASAIRAPILLVETDVLPGPTASALDGLGQATIVGGSVAVGAGVRAAIADLVGELSEVAGTTRYGTSQQIAQSMVDSGGAANVVVVSGGNWPDALVAGPLAGMAGDALILVHPTDLARSPETVAFLQDNTFMDVDLYGGRFAISRSVAQGIAAATS